jgi:hypothetical protein
MDRAIIDTRCRFCGERCFVPLTIQVPVEIGLAFIRRKVNMLATCSGGQKFDKDLIGYCFDDIVEAVPDYDVTIIKDTITGVKLWKLSDRKTRNNGEMAGSIPQKRGLGRTGKRGICWLPGWWTHFIRRFARPG